MAKSAVNASLVLTLPATISTQEEALEITNFITEGSAIRYNYVDTKRVNQRYGVDGSSETYKNPNKARFIEFTVVPLSDIDVKLTQFISADGDLPMVVRFKDRNTNFNLLSEQGYFDEVPDTDIQSNPDGKTYRILVGTYILP